MPRSRLRPYEFQVVLTPDPEAGGYVRQRGSHVRLRHPSDPNRKPLTIPRHRTLKPGLLRAAIRDAGLATEGFVALV